MNLCSKNFGGCFWSIYEYTNENKNQFLNDNGDTEKTTLIKKNRPSAGWPAKIETKRSDNRADNRGDLTAGIQRKQDWDTYMYTYVYIYYIALHCIALHYITLPYITLHYITLYTYMYIYTNRNGN